jgi:hypothetical protein
LWLSRWPVAQDGDKTIFVPTWLGARQVVDQWVFDVKQDHEAPDLWGELSKGKTIAAAASGSEHQKPFSTAELQQLQKGLAGLDLGRRGLAYHLGAIRQINRAARGPAEGEIPRQAAPTQNDASLVVRPAAVLESRVRNRYAHRRSHGVGRHGRRHASPRSFDAELSSIAAAALAVHVRRRE